MGEPGHQSAMTDGEDDPGNADTKGTGGHQSDKVVIPSDADDDSKGNEPKVGNGFGQGQNDEKGAEGETQSRDSVKEATVGKLVAETRSPCDANSKRTEPKEGSGSGQG